MPANIETAADGSAAFFSARQTAWHGLGTVTADCLTAEDAIRTAHLDWDVEKHPVQSVVTDADGTVTRVDVPNRWATVRRNPFTGAYEALGVVGDWYTVVQNIENATFLNTLVDESGAHFETAGSLNGGRRVFVTMKMPESIQIGGADAHDVYLVATNSHDGTSAFTVAVTPVRVVCQNTLSMALSGARNKISIRHTNSAQTRIAEARETLGMTFKYLTEFQAAAEALIEKDCTDAQFEAIVDQLWTPRTKIDGTASKTTTDRKLQLVDIFTGAPTTELGRGTAWGAFNAVTEYTDWYAPEYKHGNTRQQRIASGQLDEFKARALQLVSAL